MGSYLSKKSPVERPPIVLELPHHLDRKAGLHLYENERGADLESQQTRTRCVTSSPTSGVEVRALSIDSMKEVTGCLLEMNQDVVKVILEKKQGVWKKGDLFKLMEEYFDNTLQTLNFSSELENCLKRMRHCFFIISGVLKRYEEQEGTSDNKYASTLKELGNFRLAGNPFTDDFFNMLQSVHQCQLSTLGKLEIERNNLDHRMKVAKSWRNISCGLFATIFAAIVVCSVYAAVMAAPIVASALAAATALPLATVGKWVDSIWKSHVDELNGHKDVVRTAQSGTSIAINGVEAIRSVADQLAAETESLLLIAEVSLEEDEMVGYGVGEIKRKLPAFTIRIEELDELGNRCTNDVRRARTMILQRIIRDTGSRTLDLESMI